MKAPCNRLKRRWWFYFSVIQDEDMNFPILEFKEKTIASQTCATISLKTKPSSITAHDVFTKQGFVCNKKNQKHESSVWNSQQHKI